MVTTHPYDPHCRLCMVRLAKRERDAKKHKRFLKLVLDTMVAIGELVENDGLYSLADGTSSVCVGGAE